MFLLQIQNPVSEEEIISRADSAKVAWQQFTEMMAADPGTALQNLGRQAVQFGLKVLVALLIYFVGAWLIRRVKKGLQRMFERRKTDKAMASFISSFVSIALTILLIIIVIGTLGVNTTSLAALLAAGGMAIGMALSGTLQNFAGGLMIMAFKPFKAGDYIEAQGHFGWVSEINIVSTKIVTTDNREVVIPNGTLANGNIDNYSSRDPRRIDLKVNVAYGTPVDDVKNELLRIAGQNDKILDSSTPGAWDPYVILSSLNESSVEFKLRCWATGAEFMGVIYWLNETIYTELPEHGIRFPFPQMDVHLKQD